MMKLVCCRFIGLCAALCGVFATTAPVHVTLAQGEVRAFETAGKRDVVLDVGGLSATEAPNHL
jgi:hypothetical protein